MRLNAHSIEFSSLSYVILCSMTRGGVHGFFFLSAELVADLYRCEEEHPIRSLPLLFFMVTG